MTENTNLQVDDVLSVGDVIGRLRETARHELNLWTMDTLKAKVVSESSITMTITADQFATFVDELARKLGRSVASMDTNVTAGYRDAVATLDHVRKALDIAGVGAPPPGDEPGAIAAMGVRLRELGAQILKLSTRTSAISSGDDLGWGEVRKAAKRISEIASSQVFVAPEATDVHAMRCDEVCREIDAIAGHLKLSRPGL